MSNSVSNKLLAIAHRGARSKAPENTIPAIKKALALKAAGIEFDVDLSKDCVPIVIHQETLEPDQKFKKLVPAASLPSRAWTQSRDYKEIEALSAGSWFSKEFPEVRVPKLEEVLDLNWGKTFALMELKDPYYWGSEQQQKWPKQIVGAVLPSVNKYIEAGKKLQALSFNPHILAELSQSAPKVLRVQAYSTQDDGNWKEYLNQAAIAQCYAVAVSEVRILREPQWVDVAHEKGLKIYIYERTPAFEGSGYRFEADKKKAFWEKMVSLGVDAIETDFIEELLGFL